MATARRNVDKRGGLASPRYFFGSVFLFDRGAVVLDYAVEI